MEAIYEAQELEHKRKGRNASIAFAIAVIVLMLIPFLTYPTPPPGQEGILVNLGLPDEGQGIENAGPAEPSEPLPTPPEPEAATPPPTPETAPEPEPEVQPEKEVVTTEDPEAIRLREQDKERQRKAEADRIKKEQEAEAERQRQAEAERQRQEAAEAKRKQQEAAQKTKDQIGGLFGGGKGKGETGKPGNQGDPGGDPNSDNLSGVSDGVGSNVGGNLSGRGIVASPKLSKATERGTVVIYLCVGNNGSVSEARVQLKGTSAGASAQQQALANARKWRFSPGELDKQCGTITYTFKLK